MVEFTNMFVNKKIFSMAKELKIIIPFTVNSATERRGGELIEQLKVLINMLEKDLTKFCYQVQPIITKVKPDDEEWDIDHFKAEIVSEIFRNDLKNF